MKSNKIKEVYSLRCRRCKEFRYIQAFQEDVNKWLDGELIQDAMPYLSADDREMLKSRICPKCWESMFGSDD
jgi:hypothetical protein